MRRNYLLLAVLPVALLLFASAPSQQKDRPRFPPSPHVAPTEAKKPQDERKALHVPPGFEIQLVASEPDIMNPINIAFDAKGRLWVTMSSEYPFPKFEKKTKDTVKILEDFGPDGRARKITTFADDVNIPIGVLPLEDAKSAIIFSIPNVWYMADTDGDGRADVKKVLLKEYGHRDTHGLTGEFQMGFDGWVYACHGFSNTSTVVGKDGSTITMNSGNTYRFKPDGTRVNYHTHGQVNPFGLAFDPLGNLFSCDCHSQPIYQLLRGAWYPSFAKPHDGLGFAPAMMTNHHGSTAIAGIAYYAAKQFPQAFRDNIFIGNVVTNRVNRDSLIRSGSTYRAKKEEDFVKSDDRWFRPVDIKLGPDGALYIADFYNRIIGHYEVPLTHPGRDFTHGRIWRVVYRGTDGKIQPPMARPDFTTASVKELIHDLAHPNLTVRLLATHQLARRGGAAVVAAARQAVKSPANAFQKIHALWVLERRNALDDEPLFAAAKDKSAAVRVHAMRILAGREKLTDQQRKLALRKLQDRDAFVQREAAQVLAAHPRADNLRPLLDLRSRVPAADTHLLYVARLAVRNQLGPMESWRYVNRQKWSGKDIRALADVTLSLKNAKAARFLGRHLSSLTNNRKRLVSYVRHVTRYGEPQTRKTVVAFGQKHFRSEPLMQAALLRGIQQGTQERGGKLDAPAEMWARNLTAKMLAAKNNNEVLAGIDLAGQLHVKSVQPPLLAILRDKRKRLEQRKHAASALTAINPQAPIVYLGKMLVEGNEPLALRTGLVDALAATNLQQARDELVKAMTAAPALLQKHIAINLASSKQGADQLLDAVSKGKASARLLQNREVQNRLRRAQPPRLNQRLAKLTKGLPTASAELLGLLKRRRAGFTSARANAAAGVKIFEKNCAACHQINNKGGKIAPQLDGVGHRGPDRLLEDILDPSRNVDQQFRATILTLKNGQVFSGLFLREEGNVLIMADQQGKEKRFDKSDVEERIVAQMSPMPANFGEQLREQELYHLLAYLLEQQATAKKEKGR